MRGENQNSHAPGQATELLTRSRTVIGDTLKEIFSQSAAVTGVLDQKPGDVLVTRIRQVDTAAARFVIDYGLNKSINTKLLGARKLSLHADVGASHVHWLATSPTHVVYQAGGAVRLDFPDYLVRHRQRVSPRFKVPPQLGMKCFVECPGFIPFELEIVDISLQGQGMMLSEPDIELPAGTILRGCRIVYPGRRPVVVDLEIRYAHEAAEADASGRRRVGCRFIGQPADLTDLVRLFSIDLDELR